VYDDSNKAFSLRTIGYLASEKVTGFNWSGAGDVFNVFETEHSKVNLSFYLICKDTNASLLGDKIGAKMHEEKYEFRKTAR
jgi:hypothetical protein